MFNKYDEFSKIFYHKNGRDFIFCDCYGICYLFNKEVLEVDIPQYLNEPIFSDEEVDATINKRKQEFKKVGTGKERPGDIVLINFKNQPIHVGVVVQKGLMLHIMEGKHSSVESYNVPKWKNKVDSFWRYEGTK